MKLSPGQLEALRNLALKKSGKVVGWIAINEAQSLTELGLAERSRSGWEITAEGEALVADGQPPVADEGEVLMFQRPPPTDGASQ